MSSVPVTLVQSRDNALYRTPFRVSSSHFSPRGQPAQALERMQSALINNGTSA